MTKVSLGKEFKIGLPSFSNITASCHIEYEVGEDEEVDFDKAWDEVNQQVSMQVGGIDPSWMQTKEYSNFFKVFIKVPKETK